MNPDHDPITEALRASLARHADNAPRGELLAERIVSAADQAGAGRRGHRGHPGRPAGRSWRTWALPLVAAGAVGAVVTAVVGIEAYRPTAAPAPGAGSVLRSTAPAPATTTPPSTSMSWSSGAAVPAGPSAATDALLRDVRVIDLTFAGPDNGWALASADCLSGAGRCTALLRSTDGRTWSGMPGASFNVDGVGRCADPCVTHLRFANDRIGYAFGANALFMTTDGGRSWQRQPGGADALETLGGDVIRLVSDHSGCPGPCNVRAETAPIGSSTWTPRRLQPGRLDTGTVALVRSGAYAVVTTSSGMGRPTTLYRSSDGGLTWTERADPCAAVTGAPMRTTSVSAGGDGSVSVLCQPAGAGGWAVTMTSTNGGADFRAGRIHTFDRWPGVLAAASSHVLVFAAGQPVRSTDGGRTWQAGTASLGGAGAAGFAGFESTTVGRIVAPGGRTIWTTRDAGTTWSPTVLP